MKGPFGQKQEFTGPFTEYVRTVQSKMLHIIQLRAQHDEAMSQHYGDSQSAVDRYIATANVS
jgi:hypothetical protein